MIHAIGPAISRGRPRRGMCRRLARPHPEPARAMRWAISCMKGSTRRTDIGESTLNARKPPCRYRLWLRVTGLRAIFYEAVIFSRADRGHPAFPAGTIRLAQDAWPRAGNAWRTTTPMSPPPKFRAPCPMPQHFTHVTLRQ